MKLVATSVVLGSRPDESHGGAILVDLDAREVRPALAANSGAGRQLRDREAGLRGIAFDGDIVYIAASGELLAFTPEFRRVGAWRNAYLKDCHGIAVWERNLFLASAGCDAILGFDLDRREFNWAMQLLSQHSSFKARSFDPRKDDGPLMLNKLELHDVHCSPGGMYVAGLRTGGLLLFNGREVQMAVELPAGSRDARPFRNGVLFNESDAGLLRYAGRDNAEDRAFRVPGHPEESLQQPVPDRSGGLHPGFARGLAVLSDALVAGGSSPATISLYDLPRNARVLSINLTRDLRHGIHSLAAWPY